MRSHFGQIFREKYEALLSEDLMYYLAISTIPAKKS